MPPLLSLTPERPARIPIGQLPTLMYGTGSRPQRQGGVQWVYDKGLPSSGQQHLYYRPGKQNSATLGIPQTELDVPPVTADWHPHSPRVTPYLDGRKTSEPHPGSQAVPDARTDAPLLSSRTGPTGMCGRLTNLWVSPCVCDTNLYKLVGLREDEAGHAPSLLRPVPGAF